MREVQVKIPEFISIGKYQELNNTESLQMLDRMLYTIKSLTEYTEKEIKTWPVSTIVEVSTELLEVASAKNEFYPIVTIGEQIYGFSPLSKSTFGEYIDLQHLLQEPIKNLHQIAAILYRPVTKHKFKSFSFTRKYGLKTANNKVTDPFKWYTIEKYDSEIREERSEMMKDFPVQLILGAMGFMSTIGTLSLNDTLYSKEAITRTEKKTQEKEILDLLSQNIGGGLVRSIT